MTTEHIICIVVFFVAWLWCWFTAPVAPPPLFRWSTHWHAFLIIVLIMGMILLRLVA